MRIAHIVCSYPPYYSGMGNVVFETVSRLAARGHDVEVFTPGVYERREVKPVESTPEQEHAPELQSRVDYAHRLKPSLSYGNAARMPQLQQELDSFDLVHLHYPFFGTANLVRRWKIRNPGVPLVITYHMDARGPGWKGLIFKYYSQFWMPKILSAADLLIASSFDFIHASQANTLFESNKEKWIELPFGVDADRFQPREKSQELFDIFNCDSTYPTLLFVGGMDEAHYFKGVPVLLRALRLLKQHEMMPQALFVGDGSLRQSYEEQARGLGIDDKVRFLGYTPDDILPAVYNMADVLVLPSLHQGEAFGMVLLEAMASGVPVVASDLPGVRTVAQDGGCVVSPNDSTALAETVEGFFSEKTDRNAWSQKARSAVLEKYSWKTIIAHLEAEYRKLV